MDVNAKNILGGVHSDSHDVHNVSNTQNTYNTTNTSTVNTIYQAQRTEQEIYNDNEENFLQVVQSMLADGILTQQEWAQLSELSIKYHIPEKRALEIVEAVRKTSKTLSADKGNEFLAGQLLDEVYDAIQANAVPILQRKMRSLEQLAQESQDANIQYFYYLLLASFTPESCVMQFVSNRVDNYWQLFWTFVANIKLNSINNAEVLLPRLGGFGCPTGDISVLMAMINVFEYKTNNQDYYKQQALKNLDQAVQNTMSDQVAALWYALKDYIDGVGCGEDWYRFYYEQTLKELGLKKQASIFEKSTLQPTTTVGTPPPMPRFDAQKVTLNQMQGFNPLQAAQQMGLGRVPVAQPMAMPSMTPPAMPQMPIAKAVEPTPVYENLQTKREHLATEARHAEDDIDKPDPFQSLTGIIVTNSAILAQKYKCSQQEVYDVFNDFIQTAYDQQMYWHFLDLSTCQVCDDTYEDVNATISSFIAENSIMAGIDLHVLLVGGADVVPLPDVDDPYECSEGSIMTDFPYCFAPNYLEALIDGKQTKLDASVVRNNVARLPLENGEMSSTIQDDLGSYFNISGLYGGGIPVGNVVMNTNLEWIPASSTMTQHLPLLYNAEDPELIKNGMYVSPKLYTDDEDTINIYSDSLQRADMLMFNLHGSPAPKMSGFYSHDEAFSPSLLRESNARVFNTVACFGARYAGYDREDSMLLSALYGGGILLYTGSLIPVPMILQTESQQMLLNPGSGSEILMRLYALYQFKGLTAGKALLQAKCDYFNICRKIEGEEFALSTAIMFCLYGNPMLHVRQRSHVIESALENDAIPPAPVQAEPICLTKRTKEKVYDKAQPQSLLEQIRGKVDENLEAIRNIVQDKLYQQLGIMPHELESISAVTSSYSKQYVFHYQNKQVAFDKDTYAVADETGNIKRIYKLK